MNLRELPVHAFIERGRRRLWGKYDCGYADHDGELVQVLYYKATKKRVFLMAPIHHHFEKLGWAEPQIVIRFWIVSLILAMIGMATLKLR